MAKMPGGILGCNVTNNDGVSVTVDTTPIIMKMQTEMLKMAGAELEKCTGKPAVEWLSEFLSRAQSMTEEELRGE